MVFRVCRPEGGGISMSVAQRAGGIYMWGSRVLMRLLGFLRLIKEATEGERASGKRASGKVEATQSQ